MKDKLFVEKLLGENWRIKIWGGFTALLGFIALNPDSINFLPESIQVYVKGVAGMVALYTANKAANSTADKKEVEQIKSEVYDSSVDPK